MPAEHAPRGHSVTPSPCAALGMHVVTSMCPYTDLEGGKLSVQTLTHTNKDTFAKQREKEHTHTHAEKEIKHNGDERRRRRQNTHDGYKCPVVPRRRRRRHDRGPKNGFNLPVAKVLLTNGIRKERTCAAPERRRRILRKPQRCILPPPLCFLSFFVCVFSFSLFTLFFCIFFLVFLL